MEPAATIIERLGGPAVVSEITGTAYTAPYRWQHPRDKGGTGGLIPQKHHLTLLTFAERNGIALNAADFLLRTHESATPTRPVASMDDAAPTYP